jgi:hypothetical protein
MVQHERPGRVFSFVLMACLIVAFGAIAYPLYVIRPFRPQRVHELAAALAVLRIRPWVEIASVVACLIALVWYWNQQSRLLRRTLAVFGTLLVGGAAWLSRINVYELLFHPNSYPSFSAASESKLDGDEKVIAVKIGGVGRAYPIRSMSYHHIVNDTLGGVPIVATY